MIDTAETLYRQGDAAHDAGQLLLAEQLLRAALTAEPSHWMSRYTLAVVLQDFGRHREALPLYQACLAENSTHLKAWNNFGVALQYSGQELEALNAFRKALLLDGEHMGAALNLSGLLADMGQLEEARAVLAPFCSPEAPTLFDLRRALMLAPIPASDTEIQTQRSGMLRALQTMAEVPPPLTDPLREIGRTPFYLAYQPDSDRLLLQTLAQVYQRACPALDYTAPHCRRVTAWRPEAGQRRRIGFASFYFFEHSVGRVIRGLIEQLPRDRFEITVIFLGGQADDAVARAMAAAADVVVETAYDVFLARQTVADLALDVLCMPDFGMDPMSYFLGFSRLAPVQCTTWGHAETSGLPKVDWFVSTEYWDPPGAEADYTERLWRLPSVATPAYYPKPVEMPGGRSQIPEPWEGPRYFCPQSLYKLHPDLDPLFRDILEADSGARLYLMRSPRPGWNALLMDRLQKVMGAGFSRIVWLETMSRADYLATLLAADVILDTLHFSGGNTSLEALGMGRPVVTMAGRTMRSRFTAGLYQAMGLPEAVSSSSKEYVQRAIDLGQNMSLRLNFARQISDRNVVLFEDPQVIRGWTAFLDSVQPVPF